MVGLCLDCAGHGSSPAVVTIHTVARPAAGVLGDINRQAGCVQVTGALACPCISVVDLIRVKFVGRLRGVLACSSLQGHTAHSRDLVSTTSRGRHKALGLLQCLSAAAIFRIAKGPSFGRAEDFSAAAEAAVVHMHTHRPHHIIIGPELECNVGIGSWGVGKKLEETSIRQALGSRYVWVLVLVFPEQVLLAASCSIAGCFTLSGTAWVCCWRTIAHIRAVCWHPRR